MNDRPDYFDPHVLAGIDRLEVRARAIVEGFISGQHRSPYHGLAVEFAEYREYVPGDDVKHIDWKVWGRSGRLLLKQYEEETNMTCTLVVDCSRSMAYGGNNGMSKFDYGATLAACVSLLLARQQDASGLLLFDTSIRDSLMPKAHPRQPQMLIERLQAAEPDRQTDLDSVFRAIPGHVTRRGLVVVVSDFMAELDPLRDMLRQLRGKRHDVLVVHLLHEDEVTFPFDGNTEFEGLEVDERIVADPVSLREAYLEAMGQFRSQLRELCGETASDYLFVHTGMRLDTVLREYLSRRGRVGGARR